MNIAKVITDSLSEEEKKILREEPEKLKESLIKDEAEKDLSEYKRIKQKANPTLEEERKAQRYESLVLKKGVPHYVRAEVLLIKRKEKKSLEERRHEEFEKIDAENDVKRLDEKVRNCDYTMEKIEQVMKSEPEKEEVMTEERVSKKELTREVKTKRAEREEYTR